MRKDFEQRLADQKKYYKQARSAYRKMEAHLAAYDAALATNITRLREILKTEPFIVAKGHINTYAKDTNLVVFARGSRRHPELEGYIEEEDVAVAVSDYDEHVTITGKISAIRAYCDKHGINLVLAEWEKEAEKQREALEEELVRLQKVRSLWSAST
jgi:hypothetical protein